MFNWIATDIWQYLEPFNLEIELFDHLIVCKQMTDV